MASHHCAGVKSPYSFSISGLAFESVLPPQRAMDRLDDQFQAVLVVVGEEGSFDGLAGVVVVPDRGGQGEDAL